MPSSFAEPPKFDINVLLVMAQWLVGVMRASLVLYLSNRCSIPNLK